MRWPAALIFGIITVALGYQAYSLHVENKKVRAELAEIQESLSAIEIENRKIEADLLYYSLDENLAKELKARFDYKRPGETLYKVP